MEEPHKARLYAAPHCHNNLMAGSQDRLRSLGEGHEVISPAEVRKQGLALLLSKIFTLIQLRDTFFPTQLRSKLPRHPELSLDMSFNFYWAPISTIYSSLHRPFSGFLLLNTEYFCSDCFKTRCSQSHFTFSIQQEKEKKFFSTVKDVPAKALHCSDMSKTL
jgi:hypothetical protein